jgi:hypothetical protein
MMTYAHRLDSPVNSTSAIALARALHAAEVTMLLRPSQGFDSSSQSGGHRADTGQHESTCRNLPAKRGRRPVLITQADIERAIKAAQKRAAPSVVLPNGIRIDLSKVPEEKPPEPPAKVIL